MREREEKSHRRQQIVCKSQTVPKKLMAARQGAQMQMPAAAAAEPAAIAGDWQ